MGVCVVRAGARTDLRLTAAHELSVGFWRLAVCFWLLAFGFLLPAACCLLPAACRYSEMDDARLMVHVNALIDGTAKVALVRQPEGT